MNAPKWLQVTCCKQRTHIHDLFSSKTHIISHKLNAHVFVLIRVSKTILMAIAWHMYFQLYFTFIKKCP